MGHEHEELVAPRSHADVRGTERLAHRVGEAAQCEVALFVTECVVDVLQAVDIDGDDAVGLAVPDRERVHEP